MGIIGFLDKRFHNRVVKICLMIVLFFSIYMEYASLHFWYYCIYRPVDYSGSLRLFYYIIFFGFISVFVSCILISFNGLMSKVFSIVVSIAALYILRYPIFYINHWDKMLSIMQTTNFKENSKDLKEFISKHKEFPNSLYDAIAVKKRKNEIIQYRLTSRTGITNIVPFFDGTGGWVYNPEQGIFGINVNGMEQYTTNLTEYLERVKKDATIKKKNDSKKIQ